MTKGDNLEIINDDLNLEHSAFSIRSQCSSNLPKIKILATGGTIASKGTTASQTAGYKVDLTIDELIQSVPDISGICDLQYEQIMNIDSSEMDSKHFLTLYHSIVKTLSTGIYDGIVITHGTDTMEETSFFLQCALTETDIPIVISGSMRPSSSISADGPMNLYQAIRIAACKQSIGRGVLVSLNDQISSGYYITKANANSLDTFNGRQGYLGNFVNNEIYYYYPPTKPLGLYNWNININTSLDEVTILYGHQGFNKKLIMLAVRELNSKGLVFAGCGAGSMAKEANELASEMWKNYNIPIIYSKRSIDGLVPKAALPKIDGFTGAVSAGYLNPQKARILLQLCLNNKLDIHQIRKVFEGVCGG
ncbi:hypothetical protein PACTADRAFT_76061 [Pachysolen tannophilus NRRL Y-2460]|uniref:asparaginase n=1 Tax=Pachysolen tannophilus NRRL Y-2460 TaxID=669874 RepID=A0A1E4TUZ3_PACTA|nr:hypothetical protein PACTADRAFT_76061 [Pachysolen tannophilus NRRL Y-2460]